MPRLILLSAPIVWFASVVTAAAPASEAARDYPIEPVPFTSVRLTDDFWAPRIRRNHDVTIPIALKQCYDTGRVENFIKAAKRQGHFDTQFSFDDTDIYKIIEGASYTLQTVADPKLEAEVDKLIALIGAAQEPDGYLYTARTIDPAHPHEWSGPERWVNESKLSHELYNSGHLFEAAAAHFQATGKRTLLDIALKNADLLCSVFGPNGRHDAPGHQIVEMGLVKLYRVTGRRPYLDLAKFFLEVRGTGSEYSQDHKPVVEQTEAVGHAVRATYMYSGMADVAALTGDARYVRAMDAIWEDITARKLHLTGGIGAIGGHEGFGAAYELPNDTAYNETCAAIGNVYWNHRLFLARGDAKYYDVLERTLYNGLISGVSLSGDRFFYPNPLASKGGYERKAWFGCACCPSNICRFIPSVPGYVYATRGDRVFVNLYVQSGAQISLGAKTIGLTQRTRYPWDGTIEIVVDAAPAEAFELALRIPGWSRGEVTPGGLYHFANTADESAALAVNGKSEPLALDEGYAVIRRTWKKGDRVSLVLPMPVRRVVARSEVAADAGRVALQRGPIVFALEGCDQGGAPVAGLVLDRSAALATVFRADLLGGVQVVTGRARAPLAAKGGGEVAMEKLSFLAIPYHAWANRGGETMAVWLKAE